MHLSQSVLNLESHGTHQHLNRSAHVVAVAHPHRLLGGLAVEERGVGVEDLGGGVAELRQPGALDRAAEHLGLPLLDHLADDPGVLREEARGRAPRPRGPVGEVARSAGSITSGRPEKADMRRLRMDG